MQPIINGQNNTLTATHILLERDNDLKKILLYHLLDKLSPADYKITLYVNKKFNQITIEALQSFPYSIDDLNIDGEKLNDFIKKYGKKIKYFFLKGFFLSKLVAYPTFFGNLFYRLGLLNSYNGVPHSRIAHFPLQIFERLTSLQHFILDARNLRDYDVKAIFEMIKIHEIRLKTLILKNDIWDFWPGSISNIGEMDLSRLTTLSSNLVNSEFIESFSNLISNHRMDALENLNFSLRQIVWNSPFNQITPNGAKILASSIKAAKLVNLKSVVFQRTRMQEGIVDLLEALIEVNPPNLNDIDLSHNVKEDDTNWPRLADTIKKMRFAKLKFFELGGNQFSTEVSTDIFKAFKCCDFSSLTALGFSSNGMGDDAAPACADFLATSKLPVLGSIDLTDNDLSDQGILSLSELGFKNLPSLQIIAINYKYSEKNQLGLGISRYLQSLKNNSQNIREIRLVPGSVELMNQPVRHSHFNTESIGKTLVGSIFPALESIRLDGLLMHDEAMRCFCEFLMTSYIPNLKSLFLSDCTIRGVNGLAYLSEALADLTSLEMLHFFYIDSDLTNIDEGIKLFAKAFKKGNLKKLKIINLYFNRVGHNGLGALAEALDNLPSLQSINSNLIVPPILKEFNKMKNPVPPKNEARILPKREVTCSKIVDVVGYILTAIAACAFAGLFYYYSFSAKILLSFNIATVKISRLFGRIIHR